MAFRTLGDRRLIAGLVATAAVVAAAFAGIAHGGGPATGNDFGHGPDRFTVGLFGDMPYGALGALAVPEPARRHQPQQRRVLDLSTATSRPAATVPATDNLYTTALANFNTLERPLVWVPGDNDWTDCWGRYGAGAGSPTRTRSSG